MLDASNFFAKYLGRGMLIPGDIYITRLSMDPSVFGELFRGLNNNGLDWINIDLILSGIDIFGFGHFPVSLKKGSFQSDDSDTK